MMPYSRAIHDRRLYKDLCDAISRDCILLTGCGLLIHARTGGDKSPPTYWDEMLGKMVDWCELRIPIGDEKSVEDREKLKSIRNLVANKNVEEAEKAIEKHLSDEVRLQQCLRNVLLYDQAKVSKIYNLIVTIPFRAYLTTSYDTFIEDAYLLVHGHRINTFTETSIQVAIEEYRDKRPFILKLHGDINNPASINLTDRAYKHRLKSSSAYKDGLQLLISQAPFLITGFEKADSEVKYLKDLLHELRGPDTSNKHWIVIPKEQKVDFEETEEISIIQYAFDEKHTELVHFFEKLESDYKKKVTTEKNIETKEETEQKRSKSTSITSQSVYSTEIFISYAHVEQDEAIMKALVAQLNTLKLSNNTTIWSDLEAQLGIDNKGEIETHLYTADIILLLVSPDFIQEMDGSLQIRQIINRNKAEGVPVIPIIIRPTHDWERTPFGGLTALPKNKKAVTRWSNQDEALREIARGIRDALTRHREAKMSPPLRLITPSDSPPDEVS
jgi:hypothetical protein